MNIIKVIVDELPSTCHSCSLFIMTQYEGYDFCPFSALSNEDIRVDYYDKLAKKNKRPDWCPLEEKNVYAINIIQEYIQNP